MERVIKFRAWDKTGEKPYMLGPYELTDAIFNHKDIRSLPLMQFTGLTDKNGKEIYEGDIIASAFFTDINVVVVWDKMYAQFVFGGAEFNVQAKPEYLEVIGNRFENPELLTPKPQSQ